MTRGYVCIGPQVGPLSNEAQVTEVHKKFCSPRVRIGADRDPAKSLDLAVLSAAYASSARGPRDGADSQLLRMMSPPSTNGAVLAIGRL
jgi:hypothetical protein